MTLPPVSASRLQTEFVVERGRIFAVALKFGILTVLTLGIYRFWMKTKLRRIYWSGIRPGQIPLEYIGQPIEKLLGFPIAVVVLAFYIGVVNLILMFASFSLFGGNGVAYIASGLGVIPLWFYARYRAWRYVLARTRWRGIRFGLDPGAWRYAARALLFWGLTIVTLGLLWPLMTYRLEKFRTDRTWYGTARLHQGGRWTMLFAPFLPVWVVSVVLLGFAAAGIATATDLYPVDLDWGRAWSLIFLFALLWPFLAALYYVKSWKRLTNTKTADGVGFSADPSAFRVSVIYALGYFLTSLVVSTGGGLISAVLFIGTIGSPDVMAGMVMEGAVSPLVAAVSLAGYFMVFVLWGAARHAFVTVPLWQHYATTLTVINAEALSAVRQRARDEHTEAEGFAEALDLGAAI